MSRPAMNTYSPFMGKYIAQTRGMCVQDLIGNHYQDLVDFYCSIPEEKVDYQYAPGKWTVGQVMTHVIDTDAVFAYRALVIARGETQALPGFDQDLFAISAKTNRLPLSRLKDMFLAQRAWVKLLVTSFSETELSQVGNVSDYRLSVNAACFVLFGHALHHKKILQELYLK
ncbi:MULTISPECIES: DinB family protein [Chitinophagaceae]